MMQDQSNNYATYVQMDQPELVITAIRNLVKGD
jgi:hypothetical protein